jgi:hypothetical protein
MNKIIIVMENKRNGTYQKVLLNEINMLSPEQESILLDYLNYPVPITDYVEFRNNIGRRGYRGNTVFSHLSNPPNLQKSSS